MTGVFGVIVAMVLARDHFRGKSVMSAVVNLPFAVSPIIVGLMAVLLFGRGGWFEPWFSAHGIQVLFAVPSMVIVTIFICIPFVIREVAPVLQELGTAGGGGRRRRSAARHWTTFRRITLPNIRWGLLYGIALSAARSIGEVGAVLVVSGSITGKTETAPLFILREFDQSHDSAAYIVALTLAIASIVLLSGIEIMKATVREEACDMTNNGISVQDLNKRFGSFHAVQDVSLRGDGREDHGDPRAERLGQEHRPADDRRPGDPRQRQDHRWPTRSRRSRRSRSGGSGSCSSTTRSSGT